MLNAVLTESGRSPVQRGIVHTVRIQMETHRIFQCAVKSTAAFEPSKIGSSNLEFEPNYLVVQQIRRFKSSRLEANDMQLRKSLVENGGKHC